MSLPVIYVENLTRRFGDFVAVDHINFEVNEKIGQSKLGANREAIIKEVEAAALAAIPTHAQKGLLA